MSLGIASFETIKHLQVALRYASELCSDGTDGDIKFMSSFPNTGARNEILAQYANTPANKEALEQMTKEATAYDSGTQKLSDNVGKWNMTVAPRKVSSACATRRGRVARFCTGECSVGTTCFS
jgi:hypothetical protein